MTTTTWSGVASLLNGFRPVKTRHVGSGEVKEYESLIKCSAAHQTSITRVCQCAALPTLHLLLGDHIVTYADTRLDDDYLWPTYLKEDLAGTIMGQPMPITVLDVLTGEETSYNSILDAASDLKVAVAVITKSLRLYQQPLVFDLIIKRQSNPDGFRELREYESEDVIPRPAKDPEFDPDEENPWYYYELGNVLETDKPTGILPEPDMPDCFGLPHWQDENGVWYVYDFEALAWVECPNEHIDPEDIDHICAGQQHYYLAETDTWYVWNTQLYAWVVCEHDHEDMFTPDDNFTIWKPCTLYPITTHHWYDKDRERWKYWDTDRNRWRRCPGEHTHMTFPDGGDGLEDISGLWHFMDRRNRNLYVYLPQISSWVPCSDNQAWDPDSVPPVHIPLPQARPRPGD
ncbi:hypothetical protein [Endozoicomonas sp. ONNA1]|uniref:hypothetical protein n=1 Tax=Endozoicomonas sp. ONNA1 TaxID=2828740 RepID=UPI0021482727|nr:hypothetical protein [Endozoicomonas sp. ONNA1]